MAILRTNPTSYSFEIALLKKGEKVKVLFHPEQKTKIGNIEDYWYYVQTSKGYIGWIYGSFLSEQSSSTEKETIDKNIVKENIKGVWWEVNDKGDTGYRSIEFSFDSDNSFSGSFIYKFQNSYKIEGEFYINEDGSIELNKELSIGKILLLHKTTEGYRLFVQNEEKTYYFKKSYSNITEEQK